MSRTAGARARNAAVKLTERARTQRRRIIDAAEKCFVESGFHAASIADIAATADMSPGLIYRYFKNKNAIVRAIIERCLEEETGKGFERLNSPEDLCAALLETCNRWRSKDNLKRKDAVLLIETTAQSARDAEMAKVVRRASEFVRQHFEELIRRSAKARGSVPSAADCRGRAMVLQCLGAGMAVRVIRNPDYDQAAFKAALKDVIHVLMKA